MKKKKNNNAGFKKKKKKKGFTLIELLAVIIILGILMIIAIPSVTEYINSSRRNAYVTTTGQYISGARNLINSAKIPMFDTDVTYYLPAKCVSLEKGGDSPFGDFEEAYIVVTYDGFGYDYYWTSRDEANMGILLTDENLLNESKVHPGITSISTDIGIGDRNKIILLNSCDGNDTTEKEAIKTIPKDGELEQATENEEPTLEKDYSNYLSSSGILNEDVVRYDIEEIYTVTTNKVPNDAIKFWDISEQKNGSIMGWLLDKDNDNKHELYLGQTGGVVANSNSFGLFQNFYNVTKMDLSNLDTSLVTNMDSMFGGCRLLTSLDLSNWDTSKVTNMYFMFYECNALTSLNLSNWNTSNVTNMSKMFSGCTSLTNLDLSSFDTRNVTNMRTMFSYCTSLKTVNLSSFNTKNVTDIGYMFSGCSSLTTLNLNSFTSEKITNISGMFQGCTSLTELQFANFDTSKVTNMNSLFKSCSSLSKLDISKFDVSSINNITDMFKDTSNNCDVKVKNLDMQTWLLGKKSSWNVTY